MPSTAPAHHDWYFILKRIALIQTHILMINLYENFSICTQYSITHFLCKSSKVLSAQQKKRKKEKEKGCLPYNISIIRNIEQTDSQFKIQGNLGNCKPQFTNT